MANEILPINEAEVVLYQPDDNIKLDVRICNDTVWLTRQQMATLFGRDVKWQSGTGSGGLFLENESNYKSSWQQRMTRSGWRTMRH